MMIIFSLTSTDVLKFIVIPHRKLGVSKPGFGNQNELTGFRKLSFSLPHTDLTIKFSFGNSFYCYREEVGVLRNKKFQRNRVPAKYFTVASWASSKVNYIHPVENLVALDDWVTVKFFPC
jgi:hypothetical protein